RSARLRGPMRGRTGRTGSRGPRPRRSRRRTRRSPPHPRGRRLRTHRDPHPHGRCVLRGRERGAGRPVHAQGQSGLRDHRPRTRRLRRRRCADDQCSPPIYIIDAKHTEALHTHESAPSELTDIRTRTADEFSAAVSEELAALSMPKARVAFEITAREPAAYGADDVRMTFAAHDSSVPDDIGRIASGGELSRVMLAIEVVRAAGESIPTYVFDEVDAGVGGKAAVEIGRRLAKLARHAQVIVVTHLPQVAAWADTHVTIVKDDDAETVSSGVRELSDDERVIELSRMLAGMDESASA